MKKTYVTAPDLLALLEREYARRRPRACTVCSVSIPFPVEGRASDAPDWEAVPLGRCEGECAGVLEELLAQFQRQYTLVR